MRSISHVKGIRQLKKDNVLVTINYIPYEDSFIRRYYAGIIRENYILFLSKERNRREEYRFDKEYKVLSVLVDGVSVKGNISLSFMDKLRNAKGNIWLIEFEIKDKESIVKLASTDKLSSMITRAFYRFITKLDLFKDNVSFISSIQESIDDIRIYFLFFENEPTFYNQGKKEYSYRKGRIDLKILQEFKADLLKGISRLSYKEAYKSKLL